MADPIKVVKNALQQDLLQFNAISQNVANINTPGYRAVETVSQPFAEMLKTTDVIGPQTGMQRLYSQKAGQFKQTNRSLDLALQGSEYFTIKTPQGQRFTRMGSFRLDNQGKLVTQQNMPVLGKNGEIVLNSTSVKIESNGNILQDGKLVDQLALIRINDSQNMDYIGNGLYAVPLAQQITVDTHTAVKQGFIEASNVDAGDEMLKMMKVQRHIESVQKALQTYGQMLDSGINNIGQR